MDPGKKTQTRKQLKTMGKQAKSAGKKTQTTTVRQIPSKSLVNTALLPMATKTQTWIARVRITGYVIHS